MDFEDFCRFYGINVTLTKIPTKIKGFVYYDRQEYNIIISDRITYEQAIETLKHELMHIILGHFDSNMSIEEIEEDIQQRIDSFELSFS